MTANQDTQASSLDTARLAASVALLVGGVVAFYYFSDQSHLVRVLGLLAAVAVALAVSYGTAVGQRTLGFMVDARTEVRKVVWPTRAETVQTTLIVAVMVIVVAIFMWLLDMLLMWGVQALTGQGG